MLDVATQRFFLIAVACMWLLALRRLWLARKGYLEAVEILIAQSKWHPTKARVLRLGYGIDYGYPGLMPNLDGVEDVAVLERLYRHQLDRENRFIGSIRHKNICFVYTYEVAGIRYQSRNISHVVMPDDVSLIYAHNVRDVLTVHVNPKKPSDSVVRLPGGKDRRELFWRVLRSLKLDLAILVAIPTGVIYVIL